MGRPARFPLFIITLPPSRLSRSVSTSRVPLVSPRPENPRLHDRGLAAVILYLISDDAFALATLRGEWYTRFFEILLRPALASVTADIRCWTN